MSGYVVVPLSVFGFIALLVVLAKLQRWWWYR